MEIVWFTENYPPNKGGMSRSCDRIIAGLRNLYTIHIYHFTNKLKPFETQANVGGTYTAVPVFEDTAHTLNVLWGHLSAHQHNLKQTVFVAFGSLLSLKGVPLFSKWLGLPYLLCLRGNDFDTSIFTPKKQDLLYAMTHAAAIACVSREKVKRIERMQLNDRVFFTPNAIEESGWNILDADRALSTSVKASFAAPNTLVIGIVGYLKQKKGIDFFITTLLKSALSTSFQLRIVGELEPEMEEKLIRLEVLYAIVTPASRSELIANYLSCDVIAIPSIYDGMPNVLFEAGVLGIPIMASKAGGLPDVLNDSNAFLFEVLSEQSLLECFAQFKKATKEVLQKKTKQLKIKIQREHTPEKEAEIYIKIFKQLH